MKIKFKDIRKIKTYGKLNIYRINYETKNKTKRQWMMCSRDDEQTFKEDYLKGSNKINGIIIVAKHKELQKYVILREYRVAVNKIIYNFPSGILEKNESIEECVRRELKEETNLDLLKIENNNIKSRYSLVGMSNEKIAIVYCECTGIPYKEMEGNNEEGFIEMISYDNIPDILKELNITNTTSLILENILLKNIINKYLK